MRNPLFDSDSPTPVVAFLSVTSKVAASASATRIFDIPFYFSSNEWHLLLEILAILSMILGNLIAITQTSMKRMLAYSSIGQIGYVIIGIIVGDSNGGYASMITYMLFYISMNLGTFACIVLFGLRTGTDNIRDYAGLYTKDRSNQIIEQDLISNSQQIGIHLATDFFLPFEFISIILLVALIGAIAVARQ